MPKYVIEQVVPGVGDWSALQFKTASQIALNALEALGPEIQWLQTYVTANKAYSIYNSPNEELIREHARRAGFSIDSIQEVKTIVGPFTCRRS